MTTLSFSILKLNFLIVFKDAVLIIKDTLEAGFNQIAGQRLVGLFNEENELKTVDVIKNAESIYYFRNDLNELVGIDKAMSGSIKIFLDKKIIEEVRKINQIDGNCIISQREVSLVIIIPLSTILLYQSSVCFK